jgi:hypothetical protein
VFTTNKTSGANVVFQAETTQCATLGSVQFTDGGDRSTVQNFVISDGFYAVLNDNNSRSSSFVTINNNIIDPGVEARHQVILVKSAQDWVISNNTIGPVCCGTGTDSPEGIRIVPQSNNVTISNNLIQYVSRDCGYWPSSGWGSCPGTTCNPACHTDGIHIWGLTNGHIIGNRIYADDCQGIYIEHPGNETLGPIDVIDNAVGPLAESCGSAGIKIHADNATVQGTWTIAFNSGAEALEIGSFSGCSPCTFNLIGNYMPLFTLDSGGNDAGCNPPNVAVNYSYNVWTFVNGGTNTACGSHDIYTGAGGSFVNSTGAPNLGVDLHTTGSVSADNYVPTGICTPVAPADFDGQVRPIGAACDAGADER